MYPDLFTIYKEIPFPYNLFALIILPCIVILFNYIYKHDWLEPYRKKIIILTGTVLALTIIICISFFLYDNYYSPETSEESFTVLISSFYTQTPQGSSVDLYMPNKIKEKIESTVGDEIKVVILDNPVTNDYEAIREGKKIGAHLVVYGGDKRVVTSGIITEFYILPTSSDAISLESPFLDSESRKTTITPIYYDNQSIRLESLRNNVSSTVYAICAFERFRRGEFVSANSLFRSIENYEKDDQILFCIANCYLLDNKFNESLLYFNKAIEINPQNLVAWANKGAVLLEIGNYEEAIDVCDKAIEISSQSPVAWANKGVALDNLGNYEEAIDAYNKAIEINPTYSEAWYNKGTALKDLGKYEEATDAYSKVIEINPKDFKAWNDKGVSLYYLGNYNESIQAYDKAIEINPQNSKAWTNKGVALGNLGNYEEAIDAYNKAIEINPKDFKAWNDKGVALGNLGNYEEAIDAFNKAIEINPTYSEAWYNKGVALSNLGNYEEAIDAFNKAIEINPQDSDSLNAKELYLNKLNCSSV